MCIRDRVLIADEPTTALDVTIQAQILELIEDLKSQFRLAVLLITHDLGVVAEVAQRVSILYAGRVVEAGSVGEIFRSPRHPYTQGLLLSTPGGEVGRRQRLHTIPGIVPDLAERSEGCRFRERCSRAIDICARIDPQLDSLDGGGFAACHNPVPVASGVAS